MKTRANIVDRVEDISNPIVHAFSTPVIRAVSESRAARSSLPSW
jgi:hypothetical protein